jgi:hypothetical protein
MKTDTPAQYKAYKAIESAMMNEIDCDISFLSAKCSGKKTPSDSELEAYKAGAESMLRRMLANYNIK